MVSEQLRGRDVGDERGDGQQVLAAVRAAEGGRECDRDASSVPVRSVDDRHGARETLLIGGIVRAGKILHAHGDTALAVGDRVIVFAPTAAEGEVRKALFG